MTLLHDVEQRLGVLPNFFRLAPETPELTEKLWEFARYGYLGNPLPPLFKERLFVLLSRFCEVRYCLARHVGFLLGQGNIAGDPACPAQSRDDVLRLLRTPLPSGRELRACIDACHAFDAPVDAVPESGTPLEAALFACAMHVFLQTPDSVECLAALKRALGAQQVEHLLLLLVFIRSTHFWTKVHTELEFDEDVQLLLASDEELRACVLGEQPADAGDLRQRMLQQELADSRLLHEISNEMIGEQDEQALYQRIIAAAARLMHSPFASMQIVDPGSDGNELRLLGHRGFTARAAQFWQRVNIGSQSTCGTALRTLRRTIIADCEDCATVAGTQDLDMYRDCGIRSMQTTPLLTRSGVLVGMLSTHWREPHEPSQRELRLLDILARQAADLIERSKIETELRERERKYRALFESIDEGFCVLERVPATPAKPLDYLCIEANPAFIAASGLAAPAGMTVREAFPTQPDTWVEVFEHVLNSGTAARFEPTLTDDGRVFELVAFRVEDGLRRRLGVTFKDVTRRRRRDAQAALFAAVAEDFARLSGVDEIMQAVGTRIGAFLDVSACLFVDIDAEQTVATVSHGWHAPGMPDLRGAYRIDEFIGDELLHELRTREIVVVNDALAHPGTDAERFAIIGLRGLISVPFHRDGRWRFLLSVGDRRARAWRPDEIALCRELANRVFPRLERARAEAALRESEERLRCADRMKDEFLATLAHELRNPLAPIRNGLQLLRLAGAGKQPEPLHDMLERQVTHVVRLVDDLLEVSRVSRGAIDLKRETVALEQVLRIAVETSRPLIEQGGHRLVLELPDEVLPVSGDTVRLAQVFANLLNNAAKYTDPGGRIVVAARHEDGCAVVDVRDNGIGIAPEYQARLFEMFAQVDRSNLRAQGGLGIGLWLVRRLVELHGGSVRVHSEGVGRGSCFSVRLPLTAAATLTAPRGDAVQAAQLGQHRMLVVDDNADAADSLGMLLNLLGADVRVEHNGAAALVALRSWHPAAVLLDIGMPGMDGYEVARQIRSDPGYDDVLLVAVTGWGQEGDREKTRAAGFDRHLVKPVGVEVLQALFGDPKLARNRASSSGLPAASVPRAGQTADAASHNFT